MNSPGANLNTTPAELEWVGTVCRRTLAFWAQHAVAPGGKGYLVQLRGDGSPFDPATQNLVATARFAVNFSTGAVLFESDELREHATAALAFLASAHHDAEHGGYYWSLQLGEPDDRRKILYGHAFVLLAAASTMKAAIPGAEALLDDIVRVLEVHFSGAGALAEPNYFSRDWSEASSTRGQNPNMHLCEALIATYEATGDRQYLLRAIAIATAITGALAESTPEHVVWETYDTSWRPLRISDNEAVDRSAMDSIFNVVPGHQSEWAKLLGILYRHTQDEVLLQRARALYVLAWQHGWDDDDGGFYLALGDDLRLLTDPAILAEIDANWGGGKSYWSAPEAIGAAAVLESLTGDRSFARDRRKLWAYCRDRMIDEERGGWYKNPQAGSHSDVDPKGDLFDPDYHALGACFETLRSLTGAGA
jgi:mannose/cellobiose epimerase-like protein (N-acyl-D-glucosamine 2-epimerase family)